MNAMKLAVPSFVALAYGPPQGLATPSLRGGLDFGASLLGLGLLRRRKLRPAKRSFERISPTVPLMKANSDVFSERSGVLSAGTLLVLLALGGCAGGGGGGGGGGGSPAGFSYPSSLSTAKSTDTVRGFVAPYALDTASNQLVSVPQTVFAVGSATGKLTLTVSAIQLPSGAGTEPGFVVTFDPASGSSLLANSPLDSLCHDCLRTVTAPSTPLAGGPSTEVTFTYLDPAKFSLNYSTFGMWSKPSSVSAPWSEVGGPFSAGVLTRGIDLPTTGTASYNGFFIGRYATSDTTVTADNITVLPGAYVVGANANANVDFSGTGAVIFSTSNTTISGGGLGPTAESRLNLTSTAMPITRTSTSNSFVGAPGTLTTSGFGMTGEIKGGFYGPPAATAPYAPPELGGSLAVGNASGTQTMVGSFGLKKQ